MTHRAGVAAEDDPSVLHAAIGLAEEIRGAGEEIETGRRLPPPLAASMQDAGIFGHTLPCRLDHNTGCFGLILEQHWRMMGALEAADGMLLSTAFIFAVMQGFSPMIIANCQRH
jgi:hypothetical protein